MVCPRCIVVVQNELHAMGADVHEVVLGHARVTLPSNLSLEHIEQRLKAWGFELIFNEEEILLEQTKVGVLHYLKHVEERAKDAQRLSDFIAKHVGRNYNYISKVFSKHMGYTLGSYFIHVRIEKVKELIDYNQLNVSEIAHTLGYSSVHYLSNQFKKVTGGSISDYKKGQGATRVSLDEVLSQQVK